MDPQLLTQIQSSTILGLSREPVTSNDNTSFISSSLFLSLQGHKKQIQHALPQGARLYFPICLFPLCLTSLLFISSVCLQAAQIPHGTYILTYFPLPFRQPLKVKWPLLLQLMCLQQPKQQPKAALAGPACR